MVVLSIVMLQAMSRNPVVQTSYGKLRGINMKSRNSKSFAAFLGIRYAAAPLGKLRFTEPQEPRRWTGVQNATEEGPPCIQKNIFFPKILSQIVGNEDCLFLNVFSPNISSSAKLPVLFYIHGGGFHFGSSSLGLQGPEYFLEHDIVLVTCQYRLGVFGFLTTGDEVIPGNLGLKDQVKALQWVKVNIQNFGGDCKAVTLAGNNSGASSVHLHMQSPLSDGLFIRGISQSGSALNPFALVDKEKAVAIAHDIACGLKCSIDSSCDILECLRQCSSEEIQNEHDKQILTKFGNDFMLRPVIEDPTMEGAFLTSDPFNKDTEIPWLVGVNADEGAFKVAALYLNQAIEQLNTDFENVGPQSMFDNKIPRRISDKIKQYYFGTKPISEKTLGKLVDLYTDSWVFSQIAQAVRQHSGPVYYYLFDHRGQNSFTEYLQLPFSLGIGHYDELMYFFTIPNMFEEELNQTDANISRLMVKMWVNFATYGNPTPEPIVENPQSDCGPLILWIESKGSMYLHVQTKGVSLNNNLFWDRDQFWRSLQLR